MDRHWRLFAEHFRASGTHKQATPGVHDVLNAVETLIASGALAEGQRERFLSNVHATLALATSVSWNDDPLLKATRVAARKITPRAAKYGNDESVDFAPVLGALSGARFEGGLAALDFADDETWEPGYYVAALRRDAALKLVFVTACRSQELGFARDEQRVRVSNEHSATLYDKVRVPTGASLAGAFAEQQEDQEMMRLFNAQGERVFSFGACDMLKLRLRNTKCDPLSSWLEIARLRCKVLVNRKVPHRASANRVRRLCPLTAIALYVQASAEARASLVGEERHALFITMKRQRRPARAASALGAVPQAASTKDVYFPLSQDSISRDLKLALEECEMPEVGGRKAGPHYLRGLCASLLADFGLSSALVLNRLRDTAAVFRANYYRRSKPAVLDRMVAEKARLKSNEQWTSTEMPFV